MPPMLTTMIAVALVVLLLPGVKIAGRRVRVRSSVSEPPARRPLEDEKVEFVPPRPTDRLRSYEMFSLRVLGSEEDPTGVVFIGSMRYESLTEAVNAAYRGRDGDTWWVVRAHQSGAIILVMRPDGEMGPRRASTRIEKLLEAEVDEALVARMPDEPGQS